MDADPRSYRLRHTGHRFAGARLPLDVVYDLPAFRDLLLSFAHARWRLLNKTRKRLPRGFDQGISLDLIALEEGSAVPLLKWNRDTAQAILPNITDQLDALVGLSYQDILSLVDGAGNDRLPPALSSEHIRALNRFGAALRDGERIEFPGSSGQDGNVIFLDNFRRKLLITHVRETYQTRFEGVGQLVATHVDGSITVRTAEHGDLSIGVDPDRISPEFDGNLNSDVQFEVNIELDNQDHLRGVLEVFSVELTDAVFSENVSKCKDALARLRSLSENWLSPGTPSIDNDAIETAEALISKRPALCGLYRIYPTANGGILIEFAVSGWDLSVEIVPGGSIEMYGVEVDGPGEIDVASFVNGVDTDFLNEFDSRTGP